LAGFVLEVLGLDLGAPKKDVMLPLDFGFFASAAAKSTALRLSGADAIELVEVEVFSCPMLLSSPSVMVVWIM